MEDLISIHAPREGCDHRRRLRLRPQAAISIHAPREGCDGICEFLGVAWRDISIHAPREGCDSERTILIFFCYLFQSTHPARGATIQSWLNGTMLLFQSTHPARGATRCAIIGCRALENFNPRTPRGVRRFRRRSCTSGCYFNPRTPRGVRPGMGRRKRWRTHISIHAPREGCDEQKKAIREQMIISIHAPREGCDSKMFLPQGKLAFYFNPRTPRGVRQVKQLIEILGRAFQSTHPARGATANFTKEQRVCLAQFAYLHKGKKAEHTKTNAPMLHEAFLYAFWVRTGRRRRVLLDFARYKIKGSSGR